MKTGHAIPIDIRLLNQLAQHLELRRAGGDNDIGAATLGNRPADVLGPGGGRCLSHLRLVRHNFDVHRLSRTEVSFDELSMNSCEFDYRL